MTYDVYRYIFIIGAILCGVMLIVTVLIFILLNIPKVISDLSGATARKAINDIRRQNEEGGEKVYKPSKVNASRGRVTDKISNSGKIIQKNHTHVGIDGASMQTQQLEKSASETTVLEQSAGETSLLEGNYGETSLLDEAYGGTTLLDESYGGTTLLEQSEPAVFSQPSADASVFAIEYEITYIHTNELITEV